MSDGAGDSPTGRPVLRAGRRWRWLPALILLPCLVLAVLRLLPAKPLHQGLPVSRMVRAADGAMLRLTLAADGQYRLWTPLERIAPTAVEAVLLKEDRFFYWHPGVNPPALVRAAWRTYGQGLRQGGSTLTMQLARRLYRLNTRTMAGKLKQIGCALWLEARHGKQELLEAYCNLAPMGGNIEGLAAAARIHFCREPGQLTVAEGLALAVMPQNPAQRGGFGPEQQRARLRLARLWQASHPEENQALALADADLQALGRGRLPFLAPHLTDQLLRAPGGTTVIDSTIDLRLQGLFERILEQYLRERRGQGLVNGAVLLVDRRDMAVRALIGSADFHEPSIDGQVNGVAAKRSPGSTLKPFLYGLAIDQGLIHPLTMLRDAPSAFGPFQPENFDGRFAGPITARDALIRSRNVPAVTLANQLNAPDLYDFLRGAGIAGLRAREHYGLSLALGGGELTMAELAGLYAMLANDGRLRPLRYRSDDPRAEGLRLLSPQTAFLVRDMLAANPRPDRRGGSGQGWRVAWKTGTSWGFRDAWTVGLVGDFVLAVWLGNFDGQANPALVGVQAAAPLFFRMADALELTLGGEQPAIDQPPSGLIRVEVCAASGELPNRFCPRTAATWFIAGVSPIRVSTLHRQVAIDSRTGLAACPPFDPEHTRFTVFEFWPSDLERLFREAGLSRTPPPPPAPGCAEQTASLSAGDPPRLRSPLAGITYTLRLSRPEESISLEAAIDADSETMYWFADNRYLGSCRRDGTLAWRPATSARFELSVVDDQGRSAARTLEVELAP